MLVVSEENRYHRGCSQWNVYVSTECATRHSSTDCTGASDQFHCTGNYNSHTYVPSTTLAPVQSVELCRVAHSVDTYTFHCEQPRW